MPDKKITAYMPVWNGKAWVPCAFTVTEKESGKVPEGAPMIHTRAISKTAPERMQPDPGE